MDDPIKVDLAIVARDLKLPPEKIEKTVELLDAGNTIPFITRFRKDLTGGLNEQQILAVKQRVAQLRALAERKAFVLKSIESQSKLTDELKTQINKASSNRRLEDLYLPFKPKKQSRASLARQQGLEPFAEDIFSKVAGDIDLATRATDYVRVDKGLKSVDDVIKGVGDLLAERFSENDELRSTLRKLMWTEGKLASQAIGTTPETAVASEDANQKKKLAKERTPKPESKSDGSSTDNNPASDKSKPGSETPQTNDSKEQVVVQSVNLANVPKESPEPPAVKTVDTTNHLSTKATATSSEEPKAASSEEPKAASSEEPKAASSEEPKAAPSEEPKAAPSEEPKAAPTQEPESLTTDTPSINPPEIQTPVGLPSSKAMTSEAKASDAVASDAITSEAVSSEANASKSGSVKSDSADIAATPKPKKTKKKKKKSAEDPFKDYRDFQQPIKHVPNHRILAINRGERSGNLKVKIQVDGEKLTQTASAALVPENHPFSEFLKKCAHDALTRLIVPSLEREIRRELTESAEKHAVEVFANNLRNLLLQPPIRNRTVLAIDPGFKRGCSVAILDPCGNLLDSGHIFVVGNQTRRDESKRKIVDWVKRHKADVIAIGNGAACRQTEQMVSDVIAEHLQDYQTRYVMVNEAGASIYSTSEIGREELPNASPSVRSAVSIGRRLQDPLSELVKISPANIGVGMYQHDVKAKHLSESLDEVVQFCVNRVGVDVNTASPSLLKYVSGLNSLTARRVVEYRRANGQFKNRNALKSVSGFGDATFVQAAGFLRIHGGDAPLDCTSIHPESYDIANDVLKRINVSVEEFFPKEKVSPPTKTPTALKKAPTSPVLQPAAAETGTTVSVETKQVSAGDTPAVETPAVETPAVETPAAETPAAETPAAETPAAETPTAETPAVETPTAQTPSGETPTAPTETPAVDTPTVVTQAIDTSAIVGTNSESASTESAPPCATDLDTVVKPDETEDPIQRANKRKEILKRFSDLKVDQLAEDHSAGKLMVRDILMALKRPKWDPRDKVNKPIFRRGIIKTDDLKPEMQLDGQIVNVVDFGVFVDIGLGESSLVHVSQLSNHFIRDPHRFYAVGDVLKVWVSEIDTQRRRVKLTAVRPGSKKPQSRRSRSHGPSASSSSEKANKPGKYAGNKYSGRPKAKPGQRSSYGKGGSPRTHHVRKPKPKEVKPITDKMLKGDEPMRSFSDLAQFVSKKPKAEKEDKKES